MLFHNIDKFKEWLKVEELSNNTIEQYTYYYIKYCDEFEELNQSNIDNFLLRNANKNITCRAAIKRMINFFIRYKDILELTNEQVTQLSTIVLPRKRGRKKKRLIEPLTIDEIKKIEEAMEKEIHKIGLWVCYYGGIRIGELVTIRVNSFKWEEWSKTLGFKDGKTAITKDTDFLSLMVIGKGNIEREVFLPPELGLRISKYIHSNDYKYYESPTKKLFHTYKIEDPNKPFKLKSLIRNWERIFKDAGEKAKISVDENGNIIESKRTNPHKMRHSFAGNLAKNGVDFGIIKEALGHASINSTQIYTHLSPSDVKKTLKRLRGEDLEDG